MTKEKPEKRRDSDECVTTPENRPPADHVLDYEHIYVDPSGKEVVVSGY